MNPGGVIVCESDSDTYMPEHVGLYTLSRIYSYGRVRIRLYRWENV